MSLPLTLLTDRIAWILKWYLNRISFEALRDPAADLLLGPGWRRMYGLIRRLTALAAKWQAGTLPAPRASRARAAVRTGGSIRGDRLPRGNGQWICRQFPDTVPPLGGAIYSLCEDTEVMALFAAAPQAGRILRPLCRMIGLEPPAYLRLPERPRRARPARAAKSRAPRIMDINRMSAVAWGNFVHPDRPGQHHPPARIGYGGSWWPPKIPRWAR